MTFLFPFCLPIPQGETNLTLQCLQTNSGVERGTFSYFSLSTNGSDWNISPHNTRSKCFTWCKWAPLLEKSNCLPKALLSREHQCEADSILHLHISEVFSHGAGGTRLHYLLVLSLLIFCVFTFPSILLSIYIY